MPYKRSFDDPQPVLTPPCLHLRSKAIYSTGDPDPKSPEEVGSPRFHCWCNQTQHVMGPDNLLVDRTSCVAERECYRDRD